MRRVMVMAILCCVCFACGPLMAQTAGKMPVVDGILASGEYATNGSYAGMNIGVSLSEDSSVLYVAVEAPSSGWVSVGLGSQRMNGCFMVLGADDGGKTVISEETGKGHGHSANTVKILTSQAVKESGGKTVLEFAVPAAGFVRDGKLPVILAYGSRDPLNSMHKKFAGTILSL